MKIQDWDINVIQQLGMVLDAIAAAHENNDLLSLVLLEESKEQQESLVAVTDYVTLL